MDSFNNNETFEKCDCKITICHILDDNSELYICKRCGKEYSNEEIDKLKKTEEGFMIYEDSSAMLDFLEKKLIDITNHEGYKKLFTLLEESDFTQIQKDFIIKQYHFLMSDAVNGLIRKDNLLVYIINNFPEIVSFMDIISNNRPYIKFIWTFKKEDETIVDKCISILKYDNYKKFTINFQNSEILILIINVEISCNLVSKARIPTRNEVEGNKKNGYKLFDELNYRMIQHGMCWYTYENPNINFSKSCTFFPVRTLNLGKDDNNYAKEGCRKDLDHGFRSVWEANIARLLNYKNTKWGYETLIFQLKKPERMQLSKENNDVFSYIPDFQLEDKTIIEIKGFWDDRSKLNVSQFMQQYPNEKYLVIDSDLYRCINKKYSSIIPNWEDSQIEIRNEIIQVVGITLPQRKKFVSNLKVGDTLEILRESQNEFDFRAIRVNDNDGNQVGYFAKDCSCIYASKMDMGFKYYITLKEKTPKVLYCKIKLINTKDMILPDIFQ